ncbi:P-loop containing nucleoside triphosphate hydrolase protein [Syncephalis fuscata]|nr:P-loop containing nucleoside triphosphate hydrolase protein [Syncephalis fuscata]
MSRPHEIQEEQTKLARNTTNPISDGTNSDTNIDKTHRYPITLPPSREALQSADRLFMKNVPSQRVSGISIEHFTKLYQPEVALLGRSNVGKSSLLNKLFERRKLAKTSSNPGRTKIIDIYPVNVKMSVVDMPGYGRGSRVEWGDFILKYIENRKECIETNYLLIDVRRGLINTDKDIINILDRIPTSFQVIFTKIDCVYDDTYIKCWRATEEWLTQNATSCYPELLGVSSKSNLGISDYAML